MAVAMKEYRDPHSHEPPFAEFPWADQFPVCHLGNHIFPTAGKHKNIKQCEFTMDRMEKKQNKTCRVT